MEEWHGKWLSIAFRSSHTHTHTGFYRVTFKYKTGERKRENNIQFVQPRRKAFTTENIFCPFFPKKSFVDKAEIGFIWRNSNSKWQVLSLEIRVIVLFSPGETSFFHYRVFFTESVIKMIWHVKLRMNQTLFKISLPIAMNQMVDIIKVWAKENVLSADIPKSHWSILKTFRNRTDKLLENSIQFLQLISTQTLLFFSERKFSVPLFSSIL